MVDSIFKVGLQGIRLGQEQAAISAKRVVDSFNPESNDDPVEPLVDLKAAERQVQASTKVIKVGNEILGSILDILG